MARISTQEHSRRGLRSRYAKSLPARSSRTKAGRNLILIFRALSHNSRVTFLGFFRANVFGLSIDEPVPGLGVTLPLAVGDMFRDPALLDPSVARQTRKAFTIPVEAII